MRESGINATIPENLTIDDKEGFLISGAPMANENTAPGFVIFQSQYWLDSKDCECGPVSVGTTSVDITSTYPQDITMNLLNSLHIENAGFAASLAANITKNITAPNKTNAANVTTAATIAPSGAEKVAEKPAPKQPGFEGFLAIMGILAMGYIRLIRRQ